MRHTSVLIIGLGVLLTACTSGSGRTTPSAAPSAVPARTAAIGTREAAIIRSYYDDQARGRGAGRGRSGQLPPGIAKNLERGKPLPPGIAKQHLPPELLGRLPPVPAGYEYLVVAGKVLLVEIATQIIHDILLDVVL